MKNTKKRKNKASRCPECGMGLVRSIVAMRLHFKVQHNHKITDAEAFSMATIQGHCGAPYAERLFRDYREVQGGAPGLGKKR